MIFEEIFSSLLRNDKVIGIRVSFPPYSMKSTKRNLDPFMKFWLN
jgi:hypothetical protein